MKFYYNFHGASKFVVITNHFPQNSNNTECRFFKESVGSFLCLFQLWYG